MDHKLKISLGSMLICFIAYNIHPEGGVHALKILRNCKNDTNFNGTECVPDHSVGWNDECRHDMNCAVGQECAMVEPRLTHEKEWHCECINGTKWTEEGERCDPYLSQGFNESCASNDWCIQEMVCGGIEIEETTTTSLAESVGRAISIMPDTTMPDTTLPATTLGYVPEGLCECNTSTTWNNASCVATGSQTIFKRCLTNEQCDESLFLECTDFGHCMCQEGREWDYDKCSLLNAGTYLSSCIDNHNCNRTVGLECNYEFAACTCSLSGTEWDTSFSFCLPPPA
jgi:hypothetical protein